MLVSLMTTAIVWIHIISHCAICFCDYTQMIPLVDFVTRPDGSASDPNNLLPLEMVYAGITAMSFGTVAVAFIFSLFKFGITTKGAAALSAFFHALWLNHMTMRWDYWRRMMHPDASMTPGFFMMTHLVWMCLSMLLVILPAPEKPKTK